jgi:hypothetical protein
LEKSLVIIKSWRESYFDPEVADIFLAIHDEILTIMEKYAQDDGEDFDIPELKSLLEQYDCGKLHKEYHNNQFSPGIEPVRTLSLLDFQ